MKLGVEIGSKEASSFSGTLELRGWWLALYACDHKSQEHRQSSTVGEQYTKIVCTRSGEAEIRVGVKTIFEMLFSKLRHCLYPDLPRTVEPGHSSVNGTSYAYGKLEDIS